MHYLKFSICIFAILAASRIIPHPPNFTSLIALSFYVPVIFGSRFILVTLISFIITDLIIGMHSTILFTWGSVLIIGLISKYFKHDLIIRLSGVFGSCLVFYILTNFGVWLSGSYEFNISGLINCYILAIPFFGNTLIASIIYALIIEAIIKYVFKNRYFKII